VHGSDGYLNLKGPKKAQFLTERFGERGYAYMGDSRADIPVWKSASKAITVDASGSLRRSAERASEQAEHISTGSKSLRPLLKAIRPHQWLKNMLVFIPMLAGHRIDVTTLVQSGLAFICFSLIASSVYLLNDLLDLSADRAHPRKHRRPLASGDLPLLHGTLLAPVFLAAGVTLGTLLGPTFLAVMAGYYIVTMGYSFFLKRKVLIDIVTLAGLYTIRILAGAAATGIVLSFWLLAFSVFLFFALAAVKRQAELVDSASREVLKPSGRGYIIDDLPIVSQMATSSGFVSVLVLALYLNSPAVSTLYSQPAALWGLCLILLFWINRMVMIAHRGGMHDDPIVFAVKDWTSLFCGVLGVVCAAAGILL
jgi:4-hydroxybenzoate polyprenyltransferase